MTKVLIIGSKGFIGSHLEKYLCEAEKYSVWGCDVINDYAAKNYFVIDASNSDYEEIFRSHSFDICINCSGSASVPDSLINPARDYYLNTLNVFKLLDAIRRYAAFCKFLNISSAAVYGNPISLPIKETDPLRPLSPYGFHKQQAEQICEEFFRFYHIETCSLRIFSAFGAGLKKQLFWDLYKKSKEPGLIEIFGTGNESRDFIYIDDVVQAIELVAKSNFSNRVVNIANNEEISIKRAVETFYNCLDKDISFAFSGETRTGDPLNWKADTACIKELGYTQKISFEEGVEKYCAWVKTAINL